CQTQGISAAMELFFLLKRVYPPYYKWTYRRLSELDQGGRFATLILRLSEARCDEALWQHAWEGVPYQPERLNLKDETVELAEKIAFEVLSMMRDQKLTEGADPYLERYVDEVTRRP
ncbi:MAG: DUF4037 domain-containing protein, partial [Lachnospiraceae bacterium]|nr:DUF4037 domain-containing protein [Lachnospiraceae bacterium]